eukprot:6198915-Pleurochrysis_carterae.AAC.1
MRKLPFVGAFVLASTCVADRRVSLFKTEFVNTAWGLSFDHFLLRRVTSPVLFLAVKPEV